MHLTSLAGSGVVLTGGFAVADGFAVVAAVVDKDTETEDDDIMSDTVVAGVIADTSDMAAEAFKTKPTLAVSRGVDKLAKALTPDVDMLLTALTSADAIRTLSVVLRNMVVGNARVSGNVGSSRPLADGYNAVVRASAFERSKKCDVVEPTICDAADTMRAMAVVTASIIFLILHEIRPYVNARTCCNVQHLDLKRAC